MPSERPTQQMHKDEVGVDDPLVRALLQDQFPHWADKSLLRLPDSGTDNAIYRLGDDMGIRLPRIHSAEAQIEKERRWLGKLAEGLPSPVPVPLAVGRPGHGYPFPWLIYPWLDGTSLDRTSVDNWEYLAQEIAAFVLALEELPTQGGPPPRRRGTPMEPFDEAVQWGLRQLDGQIDVDQGLRVWQSALEVGPWPHEPVWVHGDLLPGNILVRDDRLSGVIDWSGAGVGDPACEAMLAWSLPSDARRTFRLALGFDDATWARARGWVVEQTVFYIPYYAKSLPHAVKQAQARLNEALYDE
jgi:aminoglycoside phosphotransferase (APT) family kinase protein